MGAQARPALRLLASPSTPAVSADRAPARGGAPVTRVRLMPTAHQVALLTGHPAVTPVHPTAGPIILAAKVHRNGTATIFGGAHPVTGVPVLTSADTLAALAASVLPLIVKRENGQWWVTRRPAPHPVTPVGVTPVGAATWVARPAPPPTPATRVIRVVFAATGRLLTRWL